MAQAITLDASKFNAALDAVSTTLRKDANVVLREQAKLLLERAQTGFTPPKTSAQGKAKIRSDIYGNKVTGGLFQVYAPELIEHPVSGNFVTLWKSKPEHRAYGVLRKNFWPAPTDTQMRDWHKSRMRGTSGVSSRIKLKYPAKYDGKTSTDLNRPAVTRPVLERYIRMVQKRVGRLKSGWNSALRAVGGKIQSMARKHEDVEADYGIVINNLGNLDNPSITVGNQAPTISKWRKEWQTLLDTRARDMVKRAEFLMRKAKKKGGF